MNEKIQITVDERPFEADEGAMLLEALQAMGIQVPTLCHHPSLEPSGACRLCMVEVTHPDWKGWSGLVTSCQYPVESGLQVSTRTPRVKEARRTLLELYLARCPDAEEVRALARSEGVDETSFPKRDGADKCVLCGLCIQVCQDLGPAAIAPLGRGTEKVVGPRPDFVGEDCTGCGACAHICPTGEIRMERKDGKFLIWNRAFDIPACSVEPELCRGPDCGECVKACPLDIPQITAAEGGAATSHIDPSACTGCGICAGACPAGAIQQEGSPESLLSGHGLDPDHLKGRTVVIACSRTPLPEDQEDVIRVPCIGRVAVNNMLECLARGAEGVLLLCRDQATCPSGRGGELAEKRAKMADDLAASAGMDAGRIRYLRPGPGIEGPEEAVTAFKASLDPSPLEETYTRPGDVFRGMDHSLEILHWLKDRPELKRIKRMESKRRLKVPLIAPVLSWVGSFGSRRVTQFVSLILLHSSFWSWAQVKWFCNPVLSCHSCALAWFACPVGVFVHYSGYQVIPFVALGTVLILGVLFARLLCGWVCPFGLLQDLIYKIPTVKIALPAWTSNVKYLVLILMVFLLPYFLGELTSFSFCRICPAAALQSTLPQLISQGTQILQALVVVKLGFLVFFLVLATLSKRSFCKVFCPIGAMLAPLNLISLWKIKVPTNACMSCNWCNMACPPQGAPSSRISKGTSPNRVLDCIFCYECKNTCPMVEGSDMCKQQWVDVKKR